MVELVPSAEPAVEPVGPDPAVVQRQYLVHLQQGRALVHADRYTEALAAFDAALVLNPTNERLLSEISWADFLSGDPSRAQAAGELSVQLAGEAPDVAGASLYNLGRIAQAQGALPLAARHYTDSLAVRDNLTVQKRLDALTAQDIAPAAVAAAGSCELPTFEGSLEELCWKLEAEWDIGIEGEDRPETECILPTGAIEAGKPGPVFVLPIRRARETTVTFDGEGNITLQSGTAASITRPLQTGCL